jgi:uncharacterized phage protein gp47/JayE
MSDYGVIPEGFNRKPLSQIMADLQDGMVDTFGPGVIQTPQSPLGQLNGLMADFMTQLWEVAEDVYQSYDPDQAEGNRLASLAGIRLISRNAGENDMAFRLRLTNAGLEESSIMGLESALAQIPGVTYAKAFVNEGETPTAFGLPPHNIGVAVIGGDDAEVARQTRLHTVEGLPSWGNLAIETVVGGYARTVFFTRPAPTPLMADIYISRSKGLRAPVVPSHSALKAQVLDALSGQDGLLNGETVTPSRIASLIYTPGVEVKEVRLGRGLDLPTVRDVTFSFEELPVITNATLQLIWV